MCASIDAVNTWRSTDHRSNPILSSNRTGLMRVTSALLLPRATTTLNFLEIKVHVAPQNRCIYWCSIEFGSSGLYALPEVWSDSVYIYSILSMYFWFWIVNRKKNSHHISIFFQIPVLERKRLPLLHSAFSPSFQVPTKLATAIVIMRMRLRVFQTHHILIVSTETCPSCPSRFRGVLRLFRRRPAARNVGGEAQEVTMNCIPSRTWFIWLWWTRYRQEQIVPGLKQLRTHLRR